MSKCKLVLMCSIIILAMFLILSLAVSAEEELNGIVTGSCVNIRDNPGVQHGILGQLYRGASVKVIGSEAEWFKIRYNEDKYGWMHSDYISIIEYGEDIRFDLIEYSKKFLGTPYAYGGSSPSGFDCSGFVKYIFDQFGINLNRVAASQACNGEWISRENLLPGDLVFFDTAGAINGGITHSGIYIGDNQFIHSSSPGSDVRIDTMASGYYNLRYVVGRRILN